MDINSTLGERARTHGHFKSHAQICQCLTGFARSSHGWHSLNDVQRESLEMVFHKIARILNGNPNVHDHWHDIAGYATLAAKEIEDEDKSV